MSEYDGKLFAMPPLLTAEIMLRQLCGTVSIVLLALLLPGCGGVFVAYQGSPLEDDAVAILEGYHRNYLVYLEEADISSVDGSRPEGILGWDATAHLLPGKHWIEIVLQAYFGGGGGYRRCVFEEEFEGGRHYKIKPHSVEHEEPWYKRLPDAWHQTMGLEIWSRELLLATRQVHMVCFRGTPSFCKKDTDCSHHHVHKCEAIQGSSFGTCK